MCVLRLTFSQTVSRHQQIIMRQQRQTATRIGIGMQTDLFQEAGSGHALGFGGSGFTDRDTDQTGHVRRQRRALQVRQQFRLIA